MVVGTVARLDNVTQYFGAQLVFAGLSWEVYHDARVGLVGPNGAGKSTILKLLAGESEPNEGAVFITRTIRVGYLPQEPEFDPTRTVIDEALDASPTLAGLEREMERLNVQMADPLIYNDERKLQRVLDAHARAVSEFEERGGLNFDNRVRATLPRARIRRRVAATANLRSQRRPKKIGRVGQVAHRAAGAALARRAGQSPRSQWQGVP